MVTSSMVGDCMVECTDYTGKKEVVRCTATECLMRDKGYNWREVPKGDTWLTTRRDSKELIIPCCPGFDESLASHKVCEGYRRFERKLSGTPVRVWLDFKMLKIYNISMAEIPLHRRDVVTDELGGPQGGDLFLWEEKRGEGDEDDDSGWG